MMSPSSQHDYYIALFSDGVTPNKDAMTRLLGEKEYEVLVGRGMTRSSACPGTTSRSTSTRRWVRSSLAHTTTSMYLADKTYNMTG
ncbi:hypothetical protein C8Q74DRAFT_1310329 [Fomes fomentarius]|nr:hypothetical protein C8Q74DRAFT_1310329 [Fomes fomentarius]